MDAFEEAIQIMLKTQKDNQATVKILQAENERLRAQVLELERKRVADTQQSEQRPIKQLRHQSSLHSTTAVERLVQTVSPRPPQFDDTENDDLVEDDEEFESDGELTSLQEGKAQFSLIAHSGEEREMIMPRTREITIPTLVKSYVEFVWKQPPQKVLILMRPGDDISIRAFLEIVHILWERGVRIIVENGTEVHLPQNRPESQIVNVVNHDDLHKQPIDFVVTLGGDGTFIRAAHAFPRACPPILAFAFGSLGFLTPFPATNLKESINFVMDGRFGLRLRARLEVEIHRQGYPMEVFQVLNECVVDRGTTSSLVRLLLYSSKDGTQPVTIVQGDGLILATPTGSTAYSLSAGGSMVHPSVPAILVTPICPHSLSFRPILVPDSATLKIQVAPDARNSAWLSMDGRKSIELKQNDELIVRFSSYPVPAVMARRTNHSDTDGWLSSLRSALNWNVIQSQKPLNILQTRPHIQSDSGMPI